LLQILHNAVNLDSASSIQSLGVADVRRPLSHAKRTTAWIFGDAFPLNFNVLRRKGSKCRHPDSSF